MDQSYPQGMLEDISRTMFCPPPEAYEVDDWYPHIFRSNLMFPLQRQLELAQMIQTARLIQPKVVMEIGCDKGGGLYHWCKCLPSVKNVIGCEIRGIPYSHLFETAFPQLKFHWMGDSQRPTVIRELHRWLYGKSIDVLFIDGDKGLIYDDFYAYLPMMSRGGIVFVHDITDDLPRAQYLKILQQGWRHGEIVDFANYNQLREDLDKGLKCLSNLTPHQNWLLHWQGKSCGVGVIYLGTRRSTPG
jgi:hypothetical protein